MEAVKAGNPQSKSFDRVFAELDRYRKPRGANQRGGDARQSRGITNPDRHLGLSNFRLELPMLRGFSVEPRTGASATSMRVQVTPATLARKEVCDEYFKRNSVKAIRNWPDTARRVGPQLGRLLRRELLGVHRASRLLKFSIGNAEEVRKSGLSSS